MTTTELTTAPAWLDVQALCEGEHRAEIAELISAIASAHGMIQPTLDRAHVLMMELERGLQRIKGELIAGGVLDDDPRDEGLDGLIHFYDEVTRVTELYSTMCRLSQDADPERDRSNGSYPQEVED